MADLPLRDADDALLANWFELTVTDSETGKVLYHNAWVTDHTITEDTLVALARSGRARWKIENEHIQTGATCKAVAVIVQCRPVSTCIENPVFPDG